VLNRFLLQAPRFALIGAVATCVHFTILTLLIEACRLPWPTIATTIGCTFGITTSYFGHYFWTFARDEPHREFVPRFVCVYLCSLAINTVVFSLQVNLLGFHYMVAFLVATGTSTAINFAFCKVIVFERSAHLLPFYWDGLKAKSNRD
jgi:putative flippase GtrA